MDARLSWPGWWLYSKIVYPRNMYTVTYLRNNRAVSWLGIEPATESRKSNVLTTTPPRYLERSKRRIIGNHNSLGHSVRLMLVLLTYLLWCLRVLVKQAIWLWKQYLVWPLMCCQMDFWPCSQTTCWRQQRSNWQSSSDVAGCIVGDTAQCAVWVFRCRLQESPLTERNVDRRRREGGIDAALCRFTCESSSSTQTQRWVPTPRSHTHPHSQRSPTEGKLRNTALSLLFSL